MEHIDQLFRTITESIGKLARTEYIVGKPISQGSSTVVPLIEMSLGFGAGGVSGQGRSQKQKKGAGLAEGGSAAGAISINPAAVLIIEGDSVRIESVE